MTATDTVTPDRDVDPSVDPDATTNTPAPPADDSQTNTSLAEIDGPRRRGRLVALAIAGLVVAGSVVAALDGSSSDHSADSSAAFESTGDGLSSDGVTAGSAGSSGGAAGFSDGELLSGPMVADASGADSGGSLGRGAPDPTAAVSSGLQVIQTASAQLLVEPGQVGDTVDTVVSGVIARGGFVASSSVVTPTDGDAEDTDGRRSRADLSLRVPGDQLDAVRAGLSSLGEVTNVEISGRDVSSQLVDIEARLVNLRAQEAAMVRLLEEASTVSEVLQVQTEVFRVRGQIEQLDATQADLADRVAFATLNLSISEAGDDTGPDEPDEPSPITTAVGDAVDVAEEIVAGMIVTVGALTPFAVLAALVGVVWRGRRRRGSDAEATAVDD